MIGLYTCHLFQVCNFYPLQIPVLHNNSIFVLDEEIGGTLGMKKFIESPEFAALNIGFALDEGLASIDDTFSVYYGERTLWRKLLFKMTSTK